MSPFLTFVSPFLTFVSGTGGSNDFLVTRFNDDGTLDGTLGKAGSITIDFGSTGGVTTDGGKAIAMRTRRDVEGSIIGHDVIVGGYTYDAATNKFRIALVDLLDDNTFDVS